jgi:acetoin utilization deacetylase AcuC-like enzyme
MPEARPGCKRDFHALGGCPAAVKMRSVKPLHAWYSDHYDVPLPAGHPFPMAKYRALRERLTVDGVLGDGELHASVPAPRAWLEAAHDPHYVARALVGTLAPEEVRRLGMPWSEALVARARAAVYGTVEAAFAALAHGVAGNLAGGTHHAFRDRGEGYCLFNDVAIAIARLRDAGRAERPLVVDLDVHQGNGTAALFGHDPSVFTLSLHARTNYPLRKERSSLDVELEDGTDDALYLERLDRHLGTALDRHVPDVVFYQAGVDAHEHDRLGRLALTHAGLVARDRRVFGACEERGLPVVVTLGGGYGRPLESTVIAHANVWHAARAARERRPAALAASRAAP